MRATARSNSNIAFIKYWGNLNDSLRIPLNNSLSMNLEGVFTTTEVEFSTRFPTDNLFLNQKKASSSQTSRVVSVLDHLRGLADLPYSAEVRSENNFPTGAGIASSASAFSALTIAAAHALNLTLTERELSSIARLGSGSASRSVPTGFVEWQQGHDHQSSYAFSIAGPEHWNLVDLIVIVDAEHKTIGSTKGHETSSSSPLQEARVLDTPRRLALCRKAILDRDFATFSEIVELDTLIMHSVMMTSSPSLIYWKPATLDLISRVRELRMAGIHAAFTIDAGANVHVMTVGDHSDKVDSALIELPYIQQIIKAGPGIGAYLLDDKNRS